MSLSDIRLDLVLVFFIYGLAFFSMGIAMALETGRSPLLAERKALRPLAVFGLLHGMHEWLEIILLQGIWLGHPFPSELAWLRLGWLVISFLPLIAFGTQMTFPEPRLPHLHLILPLALLFIYVLLLLAGTELSGGELVGRADALARYLLAVPGGLLAGWGLRARAGRVQAQGRTQLARLFRWAAAGFIIYGLTQVFVPAVDMPLARTVNAAAFLETFGFPVQVVRAAMSVLITISLLRAVQLVEREREADLLAAQQARLEALEQIQHELQTREALRRDLLRHTVIAQEEERTRIARELHDETAQFLTALSLNLATLRSLPLKNQKALDLLERLQGLTRQMSRGVYRLVRDLRPALLDDLGLVPALQYLAEEEQDQAGLKVSVSIEGDLRRLDPLLETVLFRVAQEALTNVARHARTNCAVIRLRKDVRQIILQIEDEGIGFSPEEPSGAGRGWGLAGMRERVESVGGQLEIRSAPGAGTRVEVRAPFKGSTEAVQGGAHEYDSVNAG